MHEAVFLSAPTDISRTEMCDSNSELVQGDPEVTGKANVWAQRRTGREVMFSHAC